MAYRAKRRFDRIESMRRETKDVLRWREEQPKESFGFDIRARILRQINQARFDASMCRNQRPARVS